VFVLRVLQAEDGQTAEHIPFAQGQTVRRVLEHAEQGVRSGCLGNGACGLCRVRIVAGEVSAPTPAEQMQLGEEALERGERLACQVTPAGDLCVVNLSPAPRASWRRLDDEAPPQQTVQPQREAAPQVSGAPRRYGLAVDFGTTHIRLALNDLSTGRRLTSRGGANPQSRYGLDVLTRLTVAAAAPQQAAALQRAGVAAIGEALADIAERDGLDPAQVVHVALGGNTAMLALLAGRHQELLLRPEYWSRQLPDTPCADQAWGRAWGLHPQARLELLAPLCGFVGSDLGAGVLASGLMEQEPGSVYIDCGTNSEIALWDGSELWVTAAAGGPAFEGSGISCGMPAEAGAVFAAQLEGQALRLWSLPGREACGVCGSGLVDVLACLREAGQLDELGRLLAQPSGNGYVLQHGPRRLALTKADVDQVQRAKAAIAAGLQALMAAAGMQLSDLRRLKVAGAFGRYLNVANAMRIGLLPVMDPERVSLCGDMALAGCEAALHAPGFAQRLQELAGCVRHLNLAQDLGFEELMLENLYLRPLGEA